MVVPALPRRRNRAPCRSPPTVPSVVAAGKHRHYRANGTVMNEQQAGGREALRLVSVSKVYGKQRPVPALHKVSLALAPGSFTSIMGPSGSGKSTLLQCAAGLDRPTSGQVFVAGQPLPEGDEAVLTEFRRARIGFVFQQYNLIPYLTVAQNVTLPARFAGRRIDRRATRDVLGRLGLDKLAD